MSFGVEASRWSETTWARCVRRGLPGVALSMLLVGLASAQLPTPFYLHPPETESVERYDFHGMESDPRLGPIIVEAKRRDPDFPQSVVFGDFSPLLGYMPEVTQTDRTNIYEPLRTGFPGEVMVVEAGGLGLTAARAAGNELLDAHWMLAAIYGSYNVEDILTKLMEGGWTEAGTYRSYKILQDPAGAGYFLTMPNTWTILTGGPGIASLHAALDVLDERTTGLAEERTDLSGMFAAAGRAVFFYAEKVPDSIRRRILQDAQELSNTPGADQQQIGLMYQLANMKSWGMSLADIQGMRLNMAANMADEQQAVALAQILNSAIGMVGLQIQPMIQGVQAQDPVGAEMIQSIITSRFGVSGTRTYLSIVIPESVFENFWAYADQYGEFFKASMMMSQTGEFDPAVFQDFPGAQMMAAPTPVPAE